MVISDHPSFTDCIWQKPGFLHHHYSKMLSITHFYTARWNIIISTSYNIFKSTCLASVPFPTLTLRHQNIQFSRTNLSFFKVLGQDFSGNKGLFHKDLQNKRAVTKILTSTDSLRIFLQSRIHLQNEHTTEQLRDKNPKVKHKCSCVQESSETQTA